ncbi:MAG TPA: toll/interleukin-1 receptor domain-containing protein, partial [Albitalea sp.]|nr:toll/interleukin-1 receptor domain-containing protein [Albitalea sp.]
MTDVFISYASADRERAAVLVGALEGRGWRVFWDRGIPPGKKWHDVLRKQLYKAHCVLVLLTR